MRQESEDRNIARSLRCLGQKTKKNLLSYNTAIMNQVHITTRMAHSRAHTSAKVADDGE